MWLVTTLIGAILGWSVAFFFVIPLLKRIDAKSQRLRDKDFIEYLEKRDPVIYHYFKKYIKD